MTESADVRSPAAALTTPVEPIVARPGGYYRSRRYIMVLALLGGAVWFGYDGWVKYPALNARIAEVTRQFNETKDEATKAKLDAEVRELGAPRDDWLQKVLACTLPFVAIGYLAFFLHRSRGQVRLSGDILTVPGHPPVAIETLRSIDNRQWKKKGIAYLTYASAGQERTIKLDDFLYDQTPIDDIYAVIAKRHGLSDTMPGQHVVDVPAQKA